MNHFGAILIIVIANVSYQVQTDIVQDREIEILGQ